MSPPIRISSESVQEQRKVGGGGGSTSHDVPLTCCAMHAAMSSGNRQRAPVSRGNKLTFQQMLDALRVEMSRPDKRVDVDEVRRVLDAYESDPNDWKKFTYYDMNRYKRNLIDEDFNYNVMTLGWGPGVTSCIHDHAGAHCFMKTLDGELLESRYAWPDKERADATAHFDNSDEENEENEGVMQSIGKTRMAKNDVLYINDEVGLHRVGNPNKTQTAASLHVYVPAYRKCKAFDARTGKARECNLTFYSRKGQILSQE